MNTTKSLEVPVHLHGMLQFLQQRIMLLKYKESSCGFMFTLVVGNGAVMSKYFLRTSTGKLLSFCVCHVNTI